MDTLAYIDAMNDRHRREDLGTMWALEIDAYMERLLLAIGETPPEQEEVLHLFDQKELDACQRELDSRRLRGTQAWTGGVTDQVIRDVRERTDLARLIDDLLHIELKGKTTLTGRCPFHDDSTPSFVIWPRIGQWKCYGCGTHGDALDLVMTVEHMTFLDAVRFLAQRAGIVIEKAEKHTQPQVGRPERPVAPDVIKRRRLVPTGAQHVTTSSL